MRKKIVDGEQTKEDLLRAATELFAAKGFRAIKVSEICRKAKVNIAAINYHFTSKENLYISAWKVAFARSIAAHPLDGGIPATAPADQQLRGHIRAILQRILDPQSLDLDIIYHEMTSPTGILNNAIHESIAPIQRAFGDLVRELLGPDSSEQDVRLAVMSIKSQCFGPMIHERQRKKNPRGAQKPMPPPLEIDANTMAEHITDFSLAGIKALRNRRKRERSQKNT